MPMTWTSGQRRTARERERSRSRSRRRGAVARRPATAASRPGEERGGGRREDRRPPARVALGDPVVALGLVGHPRIVPRGGWAGAAGPAPVSGAGIDGSDQPAGATGAAGAVGAPGAGGVPRRPRCPSAGRRRARPARRRRRRSGSAATRWRTRCRPWSAPGAGDQAGGGIVHDLRRDPSLLGHFDGDDGDAERRGQRRVGRAVVQVLELRRQRFDLAPDLGQLVLDLEDVGDLRRRWPRSPGGPSRWPSGS